MELNVIWSKGGKDELYKHFKYYKDNVSLEFAQDFLAKQYIPDVLKYKLVFSSIQ